MQVGLMLRRAVLWSAPIAAMATVAAGANPAGEVHAYRPAPASVAAYAPVGCEGRQILAGAKVDVRRESVTMALHRGRMVDRRGTLVFDVGAVDFAPRRKVAPRAAPHAFPPTVAQAGSVGDAKYSALVRVSDHAGLVLTATVVVFDVAASQIEFPDGNVDHDKVNDRAVAISPSAGSVTLNLSVGTSSAHPVLFVSLDSNGELVAAPEATTVAPALAHVPVGRDDAPDSAVATNYLIANGPTGACNPQRQGLDSALSDADAHVLDIFDESPGVLNGELYSPMWDLYVNEWTPAAIAGGYRARVDSELELVGLARKGWITGLAAARSATSGLISNCPLAMSFWPATQPRSSAPASRPAADRRRDLSPHTKGSTHAHVVSRPAGLVDDRGRGARRRQPSDGSRRRRCRLRRHQPQQHERSIAAGQPGRDVRP